MRNLALFTGICLATASLQAQEPVMAMPGLPGISLHAITLKVKARQERKPAAGAPSSADRSPLFHDPVITVKEPPVKPGMSQDVFEQALASNETFQALCNDLPSGGSKEELQSDLFAVHRDRESRSMLTLVNDLEILMRNAKFRAANGSLDSQKLLTTLDSVGVPVTGQLRRAVAEMSRRNESGANPEQMDWIEAK